jgi:4-hydroxy-tetrahydrodipicolinate synthase
MNREELKGLIQGMPVTLVTPFDDDYKVDMARMTEMTRWWVENGLGTNIAPLKVAAAMGEGPELSDDEWPHLLRTVVNAAGSDAVVICGLKAKNTLHTIQDARKAQDLGAIGLQIDLPFFHHSNQDDLVRHFTDISDAIDIGIMVYNTHWFCQNPAKEYMQADTMLRLKDAEHLTAIKWTVPAGEDYDEMRRFSDIFNVIDNTGQRARCFKNGGRGYISSMIAVHPPHDLAMWKLMEAKRYDEAQAEMDRVQKVLAPWMAKVSARSGGYRSGKGMLAARGLPVGPPRPPTLPCDEQEIAEVRVIMEGLGWI